MRAGLAAMVCAGALVGTAAAAPPPGARVMTVEGDVVATHSRWVGNGDRIVTDATIRTPTGDVVVRQLGGTVDGLTMRRFPGPVLLRPGMRVAVAAHHAQDLSNVTHVKVDDVKVLAQPPGFVRTGVTEGGAYLKWASGCVFLTVDAAGTRQLPGESERALIEESIASWNDAVANCSYLQIVHAGYKDVEVGRDFSNVLVFRDETWCRPAVDNDPPECYEGSAAGITTATYVDDANADNDGEIVDADIEINGADFAIADGDLTLGTESCLSDLRNTLTHELGHMLGLEHPCLAFGDPPRIDGAGQPVPSCSQANDPLITEATMYNFQECGETKKRSLEADDVAGICSVYPAADDPGTCVGPSQPGGCCSAGGPNPAGLAIVGLGMAVLGRRRRRRRG